jgi:peptide deformylase
MGKWPDPALRIPAKPIDPSQWLEGASPKRHQRLELAATILRDTARREGAVGLAAQQCGVDARMVFLSSAGGGGGMMGNNNSDGDMVLVNPRIVARSSESSMKVWTEECLVLPPTFRATVLRDDWIDVEYDASFEYRSQQRDSKSREPVLSGWSQTPIRKRFFKEQSRCLQHELDHDRGILITDHVGLDELENNVMRTIEAEGHDRRQAIAYSRL